MAKKKAPRLASLARSRTKKKTRKVKKTKKKKVVRRKKVSRPKGKAKRITAPKEKVIARIDHFFGHISVAAFKVKAPLKVGDQIHVKGHTTDFVQRIDSIQSNHKDIQKAGKGVEVGIKVNGKCRVGDTVFLAAAVVQQPMFPATAFGQAKPASPKTYENKKFLQF